MLRKQMKKFLPKFLLKSIKNFLIFLNLQKYKKMTNQKIFKEIYSKKLWSPDNLKNKFEFFSGPGSHFEEYKSEYINKVKDFLLNFPEKPNVVDLGCGDFIIGSQLRKYCKKYIAVDVFDEIIINNKIKYSNLEVDFRVLDITRDELPNGDICFLRQVLQHLSNDNIKKFLSLMSGKYKYLILTEHIPEKNYFEPNIDIITGPNIRIHKNSGVDLTARPFNLETVNVKNICSIGSKKILGFEGVLNTQILQLYK